MSEVNWWSERVPDMLARSNHELSSQDVFPFLIEKGMSGEPIYEYTDGYKQHQLLPSATREAVLEEFNQLGLTLFYINRQREDEIIRYYWGGNNSMYTVGIERSAKSGVMIRALGCITTNKDLYERFEALVAKIVVHPKPENGLVYTLRHTPDGFELSGLGAAGNPLIRGNYSAQVLNQYDHAIEDLKSDAPCGRLVIMSGPPGCGKTWMIRAMLSEVMQARFVMVSPSLIPMLGDPALLPDLKASVDRFEGPMILILEDADACLVPRMNDNMQAVQNLLNASDGIIGSALDVRIIATTNSKAVEIDRALTRPGRLCTHMEVGPLPALRANEVYKRLSGKDDEPFGKPATLAEVYLRVKRPDATALTLTDKNLGL